MMVVYIKLYKTVTVVVHTMGAERVQISSTSNAADSNAIVARGLRETEEGMIPRPRRRAHRQAVLGRFLEQESSIGLTCVAIRRAVRSDMLEHHRVWILSTMGPIFGSVFVTTFGNMLI